MQYAAFLRAINVGSANRIKMDELRALTTDLGFDGVTTYLQSGNLVFEAENDAEKVARKFEAALAGQGLKNADVMLRSREELADVVAACPMGEYTDEGWRRFVTFFREPIPSEFREQLAAASGFVAFRERELLTVRRVEDMRAGVKDPMEPILRKVKVPGTARYWHVAEAVLALMDK